MSIDAPLKVGDFCSRDGTDVHEVIQLSDDGFSGTFRCIVAPTAKWISVGEEEFNITGRYERVIYEPKRSEGKANDRTDRN